MGIGGMCTIEFKMVSMTSYGMDGVTYHEWHGVPNNAKMARYGIGSPQMASYGNDILSGRSALRLV